MQRLLFPAVLSLVAIVIGIPSYVTWSRRWPGMIAGFDPARCTDVDALTRWIGKTGVAMAAVLLAAAVVAWIVPEAIPAVAVAVVCLVGAGTTMNGCSRFTKR